MGEKSSPIRPIEMVIEDSPVDIYQKKIAFREISAPSRLNVIMDEQTAVDSLNNGKGYVDAHGLTLCFRSELAEKR